MVKSDAMVTRRTFEHEKKQRVDKLFVTQLGRDANLLAGDKGQFQGGGKTPSGGQSEMEKRLLRLWGKARGRRYAWARKEGEAEERAAATRFTAQT